MSTETTTRPSPQRAYWSERQGRGPKAKPMPLEKLKLLCFYVFNDFSGRGYFEDGLGSDHLSQNGSNRLTRAQSIFLRTTERDDIWPYDPYGEFYDLDTLLDIVEVLYDHVAQPIVGGYDDYTHEEYVTDYDAEAGQAEFREAMNEILALWTPPLRLDPDGQIVRIMSPELEKLMAADVSDDADPERVTGRVHDAVRLFRGRSDSGAEQRRAVRELADVLEALRPQVKDEMLTKDERDLFHLANGFTIRHNCDGQRDNYEDALWLGWMFHVYLSTIHLVTRLARRRSQDAA